MSAQFATTRFVPTPDQFAWTFGGREAVMRVRSGDVLELFTEDVAYNLLMAAAVLVVFPILVIFIFAQRFFVEGITVGGVKG